MDSTSTTKDSHEAGDMYILDVKSGDKWVEPKSYGFELLTHYAHGPHSIRCYKSTSKELFKVVWTFESEYRIITYFECWKDAGAQYEKVVKDLTSPDFLERCKGEKADDARIDDGTSKSLELPATSSGSFKGPGGHVIA
ncbi:hypothetical protein EW146_g8181 [Bondarzewia mesenterica]|uniref:Uncharacterized protein n=1 Tax=Bondarzewia mesenterica TaxID=1095465 RepID=A0A4S4LGP5_9AGAM|nr:hypothetical protein EW146_g8181 [Bondarzewia mesenterica]